MSDNTQSFGRIRFIEPNKYLDNSYEDLSISVDLVVKIPERSGINSDDGKYTTTYTITKDKMSFFSGTDGYMTDSPGSTTYCDIKSDNYESINENLGITNIHISYDSYLYPIVTIKFTDIRGSALMMPHEEQYYRNVKKEKGKVENFFAALFSFPSPEFTLRVKGFYGKKVEYSLFIKDFRSSFNQKTGNFDATVTFLSKMYGIYTDIPMSYLLIAPYCKYGAVNNLSYWEQQNFKFDNGQSIPTFLQLKEKIISANSNLNYSMDVNASKEYKVLNNKISSLQNVKNALNDLIKYLTQQDERCRNALVFTKDKLLVFPSEGLIGTTSYLYPKGGFTESFFTKLYDLIDDYNEEYNEIQSLSKLDNIPKKENTLQNGEYGYVIDCKTENGVLKVIKSAFKGIKESESINALTNNDNSSYRNTLLHIKNIIDKKGDKSNGNITSFYILSYEILDKQLSEYIKNNEEKLKKLKYQIEQELEENFERLLGFKPSIKNIFKLLMAHLQTFINLYYNLTQNIINSNRSINFLNTSLSNLSDVSENNIDNIPPFPAFKDNSNNTFCYPNDINVYIEECDFIDSFFNSTLNYIERNNSLDLDYNEGPIELLPTCLSDLYLLNNPYRTVFKDNSSTLNIDWIMTFFAIRMINGIMYRQNLTDSNDDFGKFEAYNFWSVNKGLDKYTIGLLNSDSFNFENFFKFISGDNVFGNTPCYVKDNLKYLITPYEKDKDGNSLSVTTKTNVNPYFDTFPYIIGRDSNGIKTFWFDINDYYHNYSFIKGDNTTPSFYSRLLKNELMDNWLEKLKSIDLTIIDEECKFSCLDKYASIPQDIFTERQNVIFFNKDYYSDNFFENYKEEKPYEKKRIFLKQYFNEGLSENTQLSEINCTTIVNGTSYYIPMFFNTGLTPEFFLLNIGFNNNIINSIINMPEFTNVDCNKHLTNSKNTCVMKIPYVLELYIGMWISCIKNNRKEPIDLCVKMFNKFAIQNNYNKYVYEYFYLISLLKGLLRNEKNEKIYNTFYHTHFSDNYSSIQYFVREINEIYEYAQKNKIVDIFGFQETYEKWAKDATPGGFIYFKENFGIYEGEETSTEWPLIRDKYPIYEQRISNFPEFLEENFKTDFFTGSNIIDNNKRILDDVFKPLNGKGKFSDRYNIYYVEYENRINEYKFRAIFKREYKPYEYLVDFFKKSKYIITPISGSFRHIDKITSTSSDYLYKGIKNEPFFIKNEDIRQVFNSFKNTLLKLYGVKDEENNKDKNNTNNETGKSVTDDAKLAMYRNLKNLYDKHFSTLSIDKDKYDISKNDSEFKRFHFIDTFYNDLGDSLVFNPETIVEVINAITGSGSAGSNEYLSSEMSVFSFMSLLCQKHNMMLLTLPVFNGNNDNMAYQEMFTPLPFNKSNSDSLKGPSYVCFYPHQTSQHLDIPNSSYKNDGFNLIEDDINGTSSFEGPVEVIDLFSSENDYIVPAFGVEYGTQKQSIFKDINVNMDNPQTTEAAVANQFKLANGNDTEPRKLGFEGQDLFKIYSNYSYTCNVQMMGCAQIMPLMYFQLNNIPMFRGAYQIIQVEHDITPGDMTTSFKGVRINKTKIPMSKNLINLNTIDESMLNIDEHDSVKYFFNGKLFGKLTNSMILVKDFYWGDNKDGVFKDLNYDEFLKEVNNVELSNITSYQGFTNKDAFNDLNPGIKEVLHALSKRATSGGNISFKLTSMTRNSLSVNSDHYIKSKNSQREGIFYDIKEKDTDNKITISASDRGCAVDIIGVNKNGREDGESSVALFHLLALEFTDSIKQLIWEVREGYNPANNTISNCVHLSSYGGYYDNENNKSNNQPPQIYVGIGPNWNAIDANNKNNPKEPPTNIPPIFIKTMYDLGEERFNKCIFNNFKHFNKNEFNYKQVGEWCIKLDI